MTETFNSFYGNRHTRRTPLGESLLDIFRRHQLKDVYAVKFYTPEVRGLNYDDREYPEAGGFQVVVRLEKFPTTNPRWSVSVQRKSYDAVTAVADPKAVAKLHSEELIATDLTTRQAFDQAMDTYSKFRWDTDGVRQGYRYNERVLDDVPPLLLEDEDIRRTVSILSMPAYETVRMGTHRLEERRTKALNMLREQHAGVAHHGLR